MRCGVCGVPVGNARNGRLVHLDAIPKNVEEHDATPVPEQDYVTDKMRRDDLRDAAVNMLRHHNAMCPDDCSFAEKVAAALRG